MADPDFNEIMWISSTGYDFYVLVLILVVIQNFYSLAKMSMSWLAFLWLGLAVKGLICISTCCVNKEKAYSRRCLELCHASAV